MILEKKFEAVNKVHDNISANLFIIIATDIHN